MVSAQGYGRMSNEEVAEKAVEDIQSIEDVLEEPGPFFLRERVTLIDISIFSFLHRYFKKDEEWRKALLFKQITEKNFPKVARLCEALYQKMRENVKK